jgi:hypothetical protein
MKHNTIITKIQYFAIAGSLVIIFFIIELIRKRKIKEEYALLWLFFSIIFILFSLWRNGLNLIAKLIGIAYPPAAAFLLLFLAIFSILIHFSVIISKQSEYITTLIQEIAILKTEIKIKNNLIKT